MKQAHKQPRRRYGQHFLHDKHVIRKIINAIEPRSGGPIIEIGPGRGALTRPLLAQTQRLHVVEIDRQLADRLKQDQQFADKLTVHQADALAFDFTSLHKEKIKIVGNLPYQISTPLLFHLLRQLAVIEEMVFMLQRELVERICAQPNCKDYGRLTVMLQSRCRAAKLFTIAPNAFTPPPKVDSALLRLIPDHPTAAEISHPVLFEEIVKSAFTHRRKTLRNALGKLVNASHFEQASIAPGARAENLSVQDFITLANTVHSHK